MTLGGDSSPYSAADLENEEGIEDQAVQDFLWELPESGVTLETA